MKYLRGFTPYPKEERLRYKKLGIWRGITFGDLIDRAADIYPRREALVDKDMRFTYSEVRERVNRLAVGFIELGIKKAERVLLQLPNWAEFVFAYFALQKIGAIPVLLIDRYRQYEISHLFKLTGAKTWIVPEAYGKTDYIPIIRDVLATTKGIKNVILVRSKNQNGFTSLERLLDTKIDESSLRLLEKRRPDPMQVAHMGPTGGTTGLPKVVPRTHNDYLCRVEYSAYALEMTLNDITLICAPIGHDMAFSMGLCTTLFSFGKVVMLDSTRAQDILPTIEKEKVTYTCWTPTFVARILEFEGLKDYDLSSLKKMYCGGGASSPKLVREAIEKLRCIYVNAYGGTEGMKAQTRLDDPLDIVERTVGKKVCPYDIYKIVDEKGNELPFGKQGELVIKGPCVFTGYYNAPEENEKVFTKDGFFRTGDLAMMDEEGNITITGRIKEMINRGGESISATEIENLILSHPKVALVAVIGMPDVTMGERVCAYIKPKEGETITFDEIIAHLKEKKASVLQFPERIEFVDSMPLTAANKIDKRALREDIKRKIGWKDE
ncbi:MAG: AMP-binding protein [Desulfobacterota bacterium]|nr:AMP-binding protein [Thermodesulfobacteriota bacterium]MDW8001914.1 AMP-binding protein [Deltaproteobacteria bacterium]